MQMYALHSVRSLLYAEGPEDSMEALMGAGGGGKGGHEGSAPAPRGVLGSFMSSIAMRVVGKQVGRPGAVCARARVRHVHACAHMGADLALAW